MKPKNMYFWLFLTLCFFGLIWLLKPVLGPFVAGIAIAYLLDPLARYLERFMSRALAASFILLSFIGIFVLSLCFIIPLVYTQISAFIWALPSYFIFFNNEILPQLLKFISNLTHQDLAELQTSLTGSMSEIINWLGTVLRSAFTKGIGVFTFLSFIVITPIVAFYLLRDWGSFLSKLKAALPPRSAPLILEQFHAVDQTLSGFLRGQASVCLLMGIYYATGLSIAVAYLQFGPANHLLWVVGIFGIAQILEGYILTPKLVGGRIGLHPIWIIFALFAGGSLFGFVGVLLAVPIAAILGVLIRFAYQRYLESSYFTSHDTAPSPS